MSTESTTPITIYGARDDLRAARAHATTIEQTTAHGPTVSLARVVRLLADALLRERQAWLDDADCDAEAVKVRDRLNVTCVIPASLDGAGKGSGRGLRAPWSDERAPQAPRSVPTLGGPQIATDGLGDAIRRYARIFPNASPVVSGSLDAWAAAADALEAERDDWKRKAEKPYIDHRRCEALQEQVARVRALLDRADEMGCGRLPVSAERAALDGAGVLGSMATARKGAGK